LFTLLVRIIIHITDQVGICPRIFLQFSGDILANHTGAHDHHRAAICLLSGPVFYTKSVYCYTTNDQEKDIQEEKEDEDDTQGFAVGEI
jgi:hypothetical protein